MVAVHNGIIENYQELKDKLIRNGYTFYSETDTEVAVKLVDYYYKKYEGTPVDALTHAMVRIRGSYALAIMFKEYPEEIYVARKDSPMILGVENGESFIASDVPAILKYTRNVYYIGNLEMARVRKGEITFFNLDGDEVEKQPKVIEWDAEAAEKAGFEHFMIKEIHEQPKAVADTLNSVLHDGVIDLSDVGLSEEEIKNISQIYIVACGSAYHAGIIKTCGSFTDLKKPEHVLKAFIRFALAQGAITYGMELMQALFSIVQGIVTTVMSGSSMAGSVTELPTEIVDKIESVGMLESIPLWIVTLLGSLLITVLSFVMILTVYGRMFKIYMYTAIAPIPISSFAGEPTQSIGKNFIRSYVGVCLEGAIIALACIIFSAYAASPPAVGDTELSAVTIVWNYVGELVFNLLVLVGAIKASDRIVREMMGLGG